MASVTSLTLTDSGQRYSTIPNVIISVPDADSTGATATTTIDSAVGRIPGRVSTISLTEGGNYYIDSPLPTITFSSPTTDSSEGSIIISSVNDNGFINTNDFLVGDSELAMGLANFTVTFNNFKIASE